MSESEIAEIVGAFTRALVEERLRQLGQVWPGFDGSEAALALVGRLYTRGIDGTMEPQEWLAMARYGAGLCDADPGAMRDICQALAEWLFAIPGASAYGVPDEWADTPLGALWWRALLRSEGDALITLREAADLSGLALSALSQRVTRGSLRAWIDPGANVRQGRRLVRRSDVLALAGRE